jgi:chromosome segregation ATPase
MRRAVCRDPAAAADDAAAAATKKEFEAAQEARSKCDRRPEAAQERHEGCRDKVASLQARITDLAKLEEAARAEGPLAEELAKKVADGAARCNDLRKRRDGAKAVLATMDRDRKALEVA